jgi:hypothetical protein
VWNVSDALKDGDMEASLETVRTTFKGPWYNMQGNLKVKSNGSG